MANSKFNNLKLTPIELEKQETLSEDILQKYSIPKFTTSEFERPLSNFYELMNWAENSFKDELKDQVNITKYVHNRITIDGQFIEFTKQNNTKITCLYKDSIISWKTNNNFEKYFIQGVFLIQGKNFEFIHCALFHEGMNHDSEVSFFVLVSQKNYQEYVNFRNAFDAWIQERDRSNLFVKVIEGEDFPYTKDYSWEDLFFPNNLKNEIRSIVENFLLSKDFYIKNKIPWKKGMLLYGEPGNGKSSLIKTLMSEYDFKPITVVPEANDASIREAFSYAEEQSPSLLYFEDLDSMLERSINTSTFLNLLDGVSAKNGLFVVATANNINKFKSNIINRPSRFDRKFEIPLPDEKMSLIYLKRWFGDFFPEEKLKNISKLSVQNKFSYAYLKELYITSMYEALSNNRKKPSIKDLNKSIQEVIKDKNSINRSINADKYLQK